MWALSIVMSANILSLNLTSVFKRLFVTDLEQLSPPLNKFCTNYEFSSDPFFKIKLQ